MTEAELLSIATREIDKASDYLQNGIALQRAKAYDYYWGKPYGDEKEGRSQLVTRDVQQQIDSVLPSLIKVFVGSESAVEFVPRGPEDVQKAEQQTELANYVYQSWNDGYQLTHDCLKDGLLQKTGVFKWYWEDNTSVSTEILPGQDMGQLQELSQDPEVDITNASPSLMPGLYDVQITRKKNAGKICIVAIPPEEFIISPASYSMYADKAPCVGHATLKTHSELVKMGIDPKVLEELGGAYETADFDLEKNARRDRNSALMGKEYDEQEGDPARRLYRWYELYLDVDFDGDGIAERRYLGLINKTKIVHNEIVDHTPLSWWSPKVMPHEPIGMSIADDLMDLQYARSVVRRQGADNLYLANSPRIYINEDMDVSLDDVLTVRPGAPIRGKGNAAEALQVLTVPFVAQSAFEMDEVLAQEGEQRTGIARFSEGVDPNMINKTATHVNAVNQSNQMRTELYARNFAEYAFKPMFKGIQYLLSRHQQGPLTARLMGQYQPVDPQVWTTEYDMTVNVGLGTGNKDQQLAHLQALSGDIGAVAQSPFAPVLLDPQKVFNLFEKKSELAGFKNADQFMNDPSKMNPQQVAQAMAPKPPPELAKAQMQIQADQQKNAMQMQLDQQKHQQQMQVDMAQQQAKAQADLQIERSKLESKAAIEQVKMHYDAMLQQAQANMAQQTEIAIARIRAEAQIIAADITATKQANAAEAQAERGFIRDSN
ncbi:MAG TPA: hypothetical protein VHV32_18830 [Candidatus Angelobacter sp.]|nr:hypothetical protein [Candidatus Angelobacter sp.]